MKYLMVQGTASSVGKSVLVTALCRIFRQDGWNVAPFKAQNMSLNSFVTPTGGEIGRAQAVQAEAACVEPTVEMNPILLKPEADNRSQLVLKGKPMTSFSAKDYFQRHEKLWQEVISALYALSQRFELIIIEGAGSPAEVNLKDRDLVNMKVARYCRAPVLLAGDIDRGGVFASLVGTLELLDPVDRSLVRAFVINKFRGDLSLLDSGLDWLERHTGVPVAGVIPYYKDIYIAEEDSVSLERRRALKNEGKGVLDVAVIALPHISNFDDFDPLAQEEGVRLRYVEPGDSLDTPDLLVLPGTKSTMADLQYLRDSGLARQIMERAQAGTAIIGICGGFQMLGERILDGDRVESSRPECPGLGLLPVSTRFQREKSTHQVRGRVLQSRGLLSRAAGLCLSGYEIHMGRTPVSHDLACFRIDERSFTSCKDKDGCLSRGGNVLGTYIHGFFHNHELRRAILEELAARKGAHLPPTGKVVSRQEEYDKLADLVRKSLHLEMIYRLAGLSPRSAQKS